MDIISLIGFSAAACTTLAFLPQVIKSLRLKETRDLSLPMCILMTTGIALWLAYGILTQDLPITIANIISVVLMTTLLVLKIKYK
jgi:MtN3 and saliva related transmembrane protein